MSAPLGDIVTSFVRTNEQATNAAAGEGTHWREKELAVLLTVSPPRSSHTGQQQETCCFQTGQSDPKSNRNEQHNFFFFHLYSYTVKHGCVW